MVAHDICDICMDKRNTMPTTMVRCTKMFLSILHTELDYCRLFMQSNFDCIDSQDGSIIYKPQISIINN